MTSPGFGETAAPFGPTRTRLFHLQSLIRTPLSQGGRPRYPSWTVTSTEPSSTVAVMIVVSFAGLAPVQDPGFSSR